MLAYLLLLSSASVADVQRPVSRRDERIAPVASRVATPLYPRKAIMKGMEGRVVACFTVNLKGKVEEPVVMETSNKIFTKPALNALRASHFTPGTRSGSDIAAPLCRTFTFRLD